MRISLLDPALVSKAGHHLEWNLKIVDELTSLGHQVEVFADASVHRTVVESFSGRASVSPLFKVFPYINPSAIDPIAGELAAFLDGAAALAADLRLIGECDLWLWPSLFAPQLYACSIAAPAARISGCIHIDPGYRTANGRMWWRYAFLVAQSTNLRANIGVTGPLLQREYAPLTATGRIECFPVAFDGAPTGIRKTGLARIGFFGHQRQKKGATLIPELVPRLLRDGFQVVVHDSGNKVRVENAPGLTILGYVPCLAEEIAKCDLVVSPLDPTAYRSMGSGIVWDAIASGVPVIVPSGTAPSLLVEETGAGKLTSAISVDAICDAIIDVQQNYEQISIAALEASRRWHTTQGVKLHVAAMLRDPI
jgi:glycosyltransferase involved in cell wall biosynthesis